MLVKHLCSDILASQGSTCQPLYLPKKDEFYFTITQKSIFNLFLNISIPRDGLSPQNLYGWKRLLQSPSPTLLHSQWNRPLLSSAGSSPFSSLQLLHHTFAPSSWISERMTRAAPSHPAAPAFSLLYPSRGAALADHYGAAATLGNLCCSAKLPDPQIPTSRGAARTHLAVSSASSSR